LCTVDEGARDGRRLKMNRQTYVVVMWLFLLMGSLMVVVPTAKAQTIADLLIHVVKPISDQRILPDTPSLPGKASTTIQVQACRGEFEPASFVVKALKRNIENLSFEATEIKSGADSIPSGNIDIKLVKVWYQGGTAWNDIRANSKRVLVPELLLNDDRLIEVDRDRQTNRIKLSFSGNERYVDIGSPTPASERSVVHDPRDFPVKDAQVLQPFHLPAGQNKQVWVTFRIPGKANPGVYRGTIRIRAGGKLIGEISLQVKVLPFALEKPKIEYSLYYRGKLAPGRGSISSELKNEQQMKTELRNMWEHGVRNPTVYQEFDNKVLLKKVLSMRKEIGMTGQPLYYLGIRTEEPANPTAVSRYIAQTDTMRTLMKPYGATDLYVYGIDEAPPELLQMQKDVWRRLQRKGVKIFTAGWTPGHFEQIGKEIDLFVDGQPAKKTEADKFHRAGHRIFSYNRPQVGVENPLVYRKNYGLNLWQGDYDGAMTYAYQDGFGSIWNDFDHVEFRDHCFTYPTVDGVIDTIAWEGFREGVDDVRYIATLEQKIRNAESRQDRCSSEVVLKARRHLESIRGYKGDDLDAVRQKIIEHIMSLELCRRTQ